MLHSYPKCLLAIEVNRLHELLLRPLEVPHLLFLGPLRVELAQCLANVEGARREHGGHVRVDADLSCLTLVELELGQGLCHI